MKGEHGVELRDGVTEGYEGMGEGEPSFNPRWRTSEMADETLITFWPLSHSQQQPDPDALAG